MIEADQDLAEELDARTRQAAAQFATAKVVDVDAGDRDLAPWFDAVRGGPGVLILDGLIAFETQVGDRTATELLGVGDLLQRPAHRAEELLGRMDGWQVLRPSRLALLDAGFADRVRPWPQIAQGLLRRSDQRVTDIDMLRAITFQPRLELRLVLLLWHLAGRWGRVEPSGIRLTLPLTQRLLGQLVGAERPSVSHALTRLAQAALVTGAAADLHLHGSLEQHLEALLERNSTATQPPSPIGRSEVAQPASANGRSTAPEPASANGRSSVRANTTRA